MGAGQRLRSSLRRPSGPFFDTGAIPNSPCGRITDAPLDQPGAARAFYLGLRATF